MKAVVAAFNQEKALVGAFSMITNFWMELFHALNVMLSISISQACCQVYLVVGGYLTASTELLTEGAAAWTFAGSVPLASWISVVSIDNNVISTGGRVLTVSSNQLIKLDCESFLARIFCVTSWGQIELAS